MRVSFAMRKNAMEQGGRGRREEKGLRGEINKNRVQNLGNGMNFKSLNLVDECSIPTVPCVSWVCLWETVFSQRLDKGLVEQCMDASAGLCTAIAAWDMEEGRKHAVPIGFQK